MPVLQTGLAKSGAEAYTIDQSLRLDDGDSAYLSRTPSSDGNTKIWTYSVWLKIGNDSISKTFLVGHSSVATYLQIRSDNSKLEVTLGDGVSDWGYFITDMQFRDMSAWYHIVVAVDTPQDVATDRIKVYVNGDQATGSFLGAITEDLVTTINNSSYEMRIGTQWTSNFFDGYLAEVYMIDGIAYDADDFGETSSTTNQWIPLDSDDVKDAVTFGTNGFYLDFADSADLGDDDSGEGNDFSVTSLVATDQVLDSPTNNFATLNPLGYLQYGSNYGPPSMSEGNLKATSTGASYFDDTAATISPTSGKWYYEICLNQLNLNGSTGYVQFNVGGGTYLWSYYNTPTTKISGDSLTTISNLSVGDILQFAVDIDNGKVWFGNNGTWYTTSGTPDPAAGTGQAYTFTYSGDFWDGRMTRVQIRDGSGTQIVTCNFGQDSSFSGAKTAQGNGGDGEDFYYTPPTGFKALNTDNLPAPEIALPTNHFDTTLYTGDGTTAKSVNVGMNPDFVWIKNRSATGHHSLIDKVRGDIAFNSNQNIAEYAVSAFDFNTDNTIDVPYYANDYSMNTSSETYVAWNWKAGGAAASNTDGTITSSVSANPTAGFSIAAYTGTGSAATIGHGLSSAPELIIVKNRDQADAWQVGSSKGIDFTDYLVLNDTAATADNVDRWNDTTPSASVFTIGDGVEVNTNTEDYIAYCFHSVEGYSKVGSYTGNSSTDGPFIYTGFKPAYVMIKRYDSSTGSRWLLLDSVRNTYNVVNKNLIADEAYSESTVGDTDRLDFVSNGFKLRQAGTTVNVGSYIYLAFAESPFKYSNAR